MAQLEDEKQSLASELNERKVEVGSLFEKVKGLGEEVIELKKLL